MKRIIAILIIGTIIFTFSACTIKQAGTMENTTQQTITITKENFEQFFSIDVSTINLQEKKDWIYTEYNYEVQIRISPKQTMQSGNVYVLLEGVSFGESDYTTIRDDGVRWLSIPIYFAPNEVCVREFSMSDRSAGNFYGAPNLHIEDASGTIVI